MLPGRHGADLFAPVELPALPDGVEWDGSIAYLDRDGVLNVGSPDYINTVDELQVLPGAAEAVASLRQAGYRICVVTNQSPIGRGLWGHDRLREIHEELKRRLLMEYSDAALDLILYSPHVPWAGSPFRKPASGMLMAGRQLLENPDGLTGFDRDADYDEYRSAMVGDRRCDLEAGSAFGVRSFYAPANVGLAAVLERILDSNDEGDSPNKAPR